MKLCLPNVFLTISTLTLTQDKQSERHTNTSLNLACLLDVTLKLHSYF